MEKELRIKKEDLLNKYSIHYLFYILFVFVWYVVNFIRVNGNGGQWGAANEIIWVTFFLIACLRYGLKSFFRVPYLITILLSIGLFYPIFTIFSPGNDYNYQFIGRYFNVCLCALLIIRCIYYVFKEKEERSKINFSPCFFVWMILMLACIVSRNKSPWTLFATVILGSVYIAPMDEKEKRVLVNAIVDGIILNFFIYQGLALLHVPFNIVYYRYCSLFSNSDCSAKFFTVSYVGFLLKYLIIKEQKKPRWLQVIVVAFGAGMWGFLFFTRTRSGYIGMGLTTIVFLFIKAWTFREKAKTVILSTLMYLLIAIVSVPIVFLAIRYIPPLRHHPIFIGAYSESLVHSWDPIDSEKYVSWRDIYSLTFEKNKIEKSGNNYFVEHILSVIDKYNPSLKNDDENEVITEESRAEIAVLAKDGERVIEYSDGVAPGSDELHPMYITLSYNNIFEQKLGIRKYIYAYYFRISGFRGNKEEYPIGYIGDGEVYTSAHNSMLDFMSRYGYVAGFVFELLQLAIIISGLIIICMKRDRMKEEIIFAVLISTAYFTWGWFYSVVFAGEIMDTMFWLCPVFVMVNDFKEKNKTVGERNIS